MKIRKVFTSFLILAIVCVFMSSGCAPEKEEAIGRIDPMVEKEGVWRVAHFLPFSGPYTGWGFPIQFSRQLAVEDINAAGGIIVGGKSYRMEYVDYDNEMLPTITATLVRKAIFDDGITVVNITACDEGLAVNELCNTEHVINMIDCCIGDILGPDNPYTFQGWNEFTESEGVILQYVREANPDLSRVSIMATDDFRGHATASDFMEVAEELGFTMVDLTYIEAGMVDFYSVLTPILEQDVELISLSSNAPGDQAMIIKQGRELGFEGIFTHPDVIDIPTMSEICGLEAMQGNLACAFGEAPTELGKRWAERWAQSPDWEECQTWTRFQYNTPWLLKLAIEKAQSFDTALIIKALGEVEFDGVTGLTGYKANKFTDGYPSSLKDKMFVVEVVGDQLVDRYSAYTSLWD